MEQKEKFLLSTTRVAARTYSIPENIPEDWILYFFLYWSDESLCHTVNSVSVYVKTTRMNRTFLNANHMNQNLLLTLNYEIAVCLK